jgi:hypothetical protein
MAEQTVWHGMDMDKVLKSQMWDYSPRLIVWQMKAARTTFYHILVVMLGGMSMLISEFTRLHLLECQLSRETVHTAHLLPPQTADARPIIEDT